MNIVFAVFVGWAMLLMGLRFGNLIFIIAFDFTYKHKQDKTKRKG